MGEKIHRYNYLKFFILDKKGSHNEGNILN